MRIFSLLVLLLIVGCAPEPKVERVAASPGGGSRTGVVGFCQMNKGRKVGDGQCWALADEAMKSAGRNRPGSHMRVWGRVVHRARETVRAGDIVEFENARFRDDKMTVITGSHHTAVVMTDESAGKFVVAEQNFGGGQRVSFREMSLKTHVSGKVAVYRPG
ncbi:MAG: hypothetical protein ABIT37_02040 [Luteolibacter sp.]